MTLEESVADLRLMSLCTCGAEVCKQNALQEPERMMKVIWSLTEVVLLLNSKLAAIETLLSTSTPGLEKPSEKQNVTGQREIYPKPRLRSW